MNSIRTASPGRRVEYLPTWRGGAGVYVADGTCPRCGYDQAEDEGPYYRGAAGDVMDWDWECPRCGLEWTVREYPDPVYEGLTEEEKAHHYCEPIREVIV